MPLALWSISLTNAGPLEGLVKALKHYSGDFYGAIDDLERANRPALPRCMVANSAEGIASSIKAGASAPVLHR